MKYVRQRLGEAFVRRELQKAPGSRKTHERRGGRWCQICLANLGFLSWVSQTQRIESSIFVTFSVKRRTMEAPLGAGMLQFRETVTHHRGQHTA